MTLENSLYALCIILIILLCGVGIYNENMPETKEEYHNRQLEESNYTPLMNGSIIFRSWESEKKSYNDCVRMYIMINDNRTYNINITNEWFYSGIHSYTNGTWIMLGEASGGGHHVNFDIMVQCEETKEFAGKRHTH